MSVPGPPTGEVISSVSKCECLASAWIATPAAQAVTIAAQRGTISTALGSAIAQASGGRYAHISTADRLIDQLQRAHRAKLVHYEVPLAWPPLMWIAFVGALTLEWMLRRKYMLR